MDRFTLIHFFLWLRQNKLVAIVNDDLDVQSFSLTDDGKLVKLEYGLKITSWHLQDY